MKARERSIRKVICEIENLYPEDNTITNYKDFLNHRHCLPFYKFNKEVFKSLVYLTYDLWNTKERINRTSLIQIMKLYYAKANSNYKIELETSDKLFYLYKQVIYFENVSVNSKALDELKRAMNRICSNMILSEDNQKWLCYHFYDSDFFLNRLLRYKERSSVISNWARYIYKINILSDRRAELASWIIDEDSTFEINIETIRNDYKHIFTHSSDTVKQLYEIERIELLKREALIPPEVRLKPRDISNIDRFFLLKGYFRIPQEMLRENNIDKNSMFDIDRHFYSNKELLIRASNLWATGYSRLSKKAKSKRLQKFYSKDVEISYINICERYKLTEPLNWLITNE
jgi:hypothetical protein